MNEQMRYGLLYRHLQPLMELKGSLAWNIVTIGK